LKIRAQVVVHKIEKRCEVGESDFAGLGLSAIGDALQESLYEVNREFLQFPIAMFPAERRDYRLIGP
jgi:hypothetical protein